MADPEVPLSSQLSTGNPNQKMMEKMADLEVPYWKPPFVFGLVLHWGYGWNAHSNLIDEILRFDREQALRHFSWILYLFLMFSSDGGSRISTCPVQLVACEDAAGIRSQYFF